MTLLRAHPAIVDGAFVFFAVAIAASIAGRTALLAHFPFRSVSALASGANQRNALISSVGADESAPCGDAGDAPVRASYIAAREKRRG